LTPTRRRRAMALGQAVLPPTVAQRAARQVARQAARPRQAE